MRNGKLTGWRVTLPAAAAWLSAATLSADVVVLKAMRVHTVSGEVLSAATIVVRDGKIEAVGDDLAVPEGARVIEKPGGVITPGLVEASCALDFQVPQSPPRFGRGSVRAALDEFLRAAQEHKRACGCDDVIHATRYGDPLNHLGADAADGADGEMGSVGPSASLSWAEHSSEVIPHLFVIDSVNLLSNDFDRLLKEGVTTVFVSPDSASVIGTRGAIVKTGGPLGSRIVRRAAAAKATMGGDPSRRGRRNRLPPWRGPQPTFHTRRPTTRMGVDFVFRKAFYDARRDGKGLALHGADTPPAAALPILRQVLAGEVPLRIQARKQHDIFSALRLAKEFELRFTLEEGIEAYQCLAQLRAADVPVIFGPIYVTPRGYRRRSGEADDPRLNTAKQLLDAGVRFALTAHELRGEEGLIRQGMFAVRYGLSEDEALKAITASAAELIGIADQVGVLEPGKAADLVIWSAEPFDPTSRVWLVMIDGQVVYEE